MEMTGIHMTDEFAAQYFHKMGWMWGRLEVMKEQETWGDLHDKFIKKELRKEIANEIEEKRKPYLDLCNDKQSEDYQFYLGVCNGMKLAALVAEKPNGN